MNANTGSSPDQERLALDRFKIENEIDLRREELAIARERLRFESAKHGASPLVVTLVAAALGILGTVVGAYWQGRANSQLERQKFEFSLLQRAFETQDRTAAAYYLEFISETGLIEDPVLRSRITRYVANPESIPALPTDPFASRPACPKVTLDIQQGTLNGLPPTTSQGVVKATLPCWTGDTPDGSSFNFGGGVFFLKDDFYFYTGRNYIEVRRDFKGIVTPSILGLTSAEVRSHFGEPISVSGAPNTWMLFSRRSGCLRVVLENNRVKAIAVHAHPCESIVSWYGMY